MAVGVEGEDEQNFTEFFTEKCSDQLVDGTARENEVNVKASRTACLMMMMDDGGGNTILCYY